MNSNQNTIKHDTQKRQDVSPFPAGDHKAKMNRQENRTNTKPQLQTSVRCISACHSYLCYMSFTKSQTMTLNVAY